MPISDLLKSRAKTIFLVLIITGVAVMISSLAMAFTIRLNNSIDLYVAESTALSVGIVMFCMGVILMKSGENIFGTNVTETERKRLHDDMHEQVMSEMRLSQKDIGIQESLKDTEDELFK